MKKLGLIVNPRAGLGGRVGLKGSDGEAIQRRAKELGAKGEASKKAKRALEILKKEMKDTKLEIITYPKEMGEDVALQCDLPTRAIGSIQSGDTRSEDTKRAARDLLERGIDLLLFAGGDGTARDIFDAIGCDAPALGIPAGVKIHSAVYSTSPIAAGELAASFLKGRTIALRESEVMDIDERAFREERLSATLYGYMMVPYEENLVQDLKAGSLASDAKATNSIACQVVEEMEDGVIYLIGPGTTTRAVMERLNLPSSLLGVDGVLDKILVGRDLSERGILNLIEGRKAKILVTAIGGQGYIFGRGNQPLSPKVIRSVGRDNILVIATRNKLSSLRGRPLLVDTGDEEIDRLLAGYQRVLVDYGQEVVYKVK